MSVSTLSLTVKQEHFRLALEAIEGGGTREDSCVLAVAAREAVGRLCTVRYSAIYFSDHPTAANGYAVLSDPANRLQGDFDDAVNYRTQANRHGHTLDVDEARFALLLAQTPIVLELEMYLP